jgi:hypothetical protein
VVRAMLRAVKRLPPSAEPPPAGVGPPQRRRDPGGGVAGPVAELAPSQVRWTADPTLFVPGNPPYPE